MGPPGNNLDHFNFTTRTNADLQVADKRLRLVEGLCSVNSSSRYRD